MARLEWSQGRQGNDERFEKQPFGEKSPLAQRRDVHRLNISLHTIEGCDIIDRVSLLCPQRAVLKAMSLKCRGRDLGWSSANPKVRDPLQVPKRPSHLLQ